MCQNRKCPEYVVALLSYLDFELRTAMWNINQSEYESPFSNTGNKFKCNTFEVQAYNEDLNTTQYNFIYFVDKSKANIDHIKIGWYKHLGRNTFINDYYDPSIMVNMFNDCLKEIRCLNDRSDNL